MTSSLFTKLTEFANSPKGQQALRRAQEKAQQLANDPRARQAVRSATEKVQQLARDPKNRAKLDEVRRRFQSGSGGKGAGPAA
ncbi:MAG TPA: hypothetical protein VGN47_12925 [Blastococcus sp.]|jgi:ribosomal protein L29|nr:hypothetical protein [Blastococcus sp.]